MTRLFVISALLLVSAICAFAQAEAEAEAVRTYAVFTGVQTIPIALHHSQQEELAPKLNIRLIQLTSSIAATVLQQKWNTIRLLPGQTVLSSVEVTIPEVRVPVGFLLQAVDAAGKVYGTTHLRAFPKKYLERLETLAGEGNIALFDPDAVFGATLREQSVDFSELKTAEGFTGRFVVIVADAANVEAEAVAKELSRRNIAAIWFRKIETATDPLIALPWKGSRTVYVLDLPELAALQTAGMQAVLLRIAESNFAN